MNERGARDWYAKGVAGHYADQGDAYVNPHTPTIQKLVSVILREWQPDVSNVLDLACGAGEFTQALKQSVSTNNSINISGCDPFTHANFVRSTGLPCLDLDFDAISKGGLIGQRFSLIACSFAMHLCPVSALPALCVALSQLTPELLILTPHKRPVIRREFGFELTREWLVDRVRARVYRSGLGVDTLCAK